MSTLALPRTPRSRTVIGLLLALLVQGLFVTLLRVGHPSRGPSAETLLELRLLADRPRNVEATKDEFHKPYLPVLPPPYDPVWPEAGVAAPAPAQPAPQAPESANATVAAPRPAPLNLALPAHRPASGPRPESMLSQMLNDPRSNSPKRTLEAAIADAAGTLPVETSVSTDGLGSTLIRQGSKCWRVTEARIKTIDPMDEASKGAPATWGRCVND